MLYSLHCLPIALHVSLSELLNVKYMCHLSFGFAYPFEDIFAYLWKISFSGKCGRHFNFLPVNDIVLIYFPVA